MEIRERGMTFIETLVWVSVFTAVMLALSMSLLTFYRTNTYTLHQGFAVASAERGVARMMRIIRETTYSSEGAYPIVSIGPQELVFYADIDADPLIERVRYFVSGTSLMQGVLDASGDPPAYTGEEALSVVSDNVRNGAQPVTTFRYWSAGGEEITDYADVANVRFVTLSLVVNVDENRLPNEFTLRSSATLRNLK